MAIRSTSGLQIGEKFLVEIDGVGYEFEVAEEGGYVVRIPAYGDCGSQGETFEEALLNAEDALVESLRAAAELGLEIPPDLQHLAKS